MRIRLVTPRLDAEAQRVSRFMAVSALAHVLFVAAMVLIPSLRPKRPVIDTPLFVELVAPAPAATVEAPPAPPAPVPTPPASEGVRAQVEVPEPKPLPEEPPVKTPEPKPEPEPTPPPPRPAPPAPPVEEQPPEAATVGPGGPGGPPGGASITALEGVGDVELGWYKSQVIAALYGQWRKPIVDGLTDPHEARVTFEIQRDGSIRGLALSERSGVASLDRSALRAVADAAPLPPLPPNWRESTLSAGFVFRLYPEQR